MKTLREHLDDYMRLLVSLNFCATTMRIRRYNVLEFIHWLENIAGATTPDVLHEDQLRRWQVMLGNRRTAAGMPLKPTSLNKKIEGVRMFLEYLKEEGLITSRLTGVLKYVRVPSPLPRVITHEETRRMLDGIDTGSAAGFRDRTMLEVLYSCGLRASELLGMNLADINFDDALALVHGKGRKERMVPVGTTALRFLESYIRAVRPGLRPLPKEDAVFLNTDGRRMPYHTLRRIVLRIARDAGLEGRVTAHVFRRSCTSELVRGDANLYHVSRLLGHEDLETLKHYVKLHINDLRETHHKTHPRERDEEERGK
jgi:site-specific recombinase XerD